MLPIGVVVQRANMLLSGFQTFWPREK